jgi:hypothetical protein
MDNKLDKINNTNNIPLIYIYIYKKICEDTKTLKLKVITYRILISEFNQILHRLPRKYYDIIIKELVDFNLIEKVAGGRSPSYKINHEDYDNKLNELNNIEKSGLRFRILKNKFEKLLKSLEQVNDLDKKYNLLKCDYEKLLRKNELKKLESSHYW